MKSVLLFMTSSGRARTEMLAGVREFMRGTDLNLVVLESDGSPFPVRKQIAFWSPVGCIVEGNGKNATADTVPPEAFGSLPVVYIGCEAPIMPKGATHVMHDAVATSNAAARELLSLGLRSFAFVGVCGKKWSDRRKDAFAAALETNGEQMSSIDFDMASSVDYESEARRLRVWLDALPKPCGLMAANDAMAEIVLSICKMSNIAVPDDIAVIGVDDAESICENTTPKLSSVRPDFRQGGTLAAMLLVKKLNGDTARRSVVFSIQGLVRRSSTRVFRRKDSEVADALERIWAPDGVHLSAKEILSGFSCSRRNAEIRFRAMTGRSVLQELAAARLQLAKRLLSETSLQVSEIAENCGYRFTTHFRKIFHSATGTNPLAWRKAKNPIAPDVMDAHQ